MAIRDIVKALSGKKKEKEQALVPENKQDEAKDFLTGADFPVIRASELDMSRYRKVPLTGLAALGAAFSTLPRRRTPSQRAPLRASCPTSRCL